MAILFLILAYFFRFKQSGTSMLDPMQPDAYGMFLVHYPIVLWLQYWLFDFNLPAIVKATIGFVLTVILSWGADARIADDTGRGEGALGGRAASIPVIARSEATKQSAFLLRRREAGLLRGPVIGCAFARPVASQ